MNSIINFCAGLPEKYFAAGETILRLGENSNALYILIDGEFTVSKNNVQIDVQSEPGTLYGELSVLLDIPHSATVTATRPTRAYYVENAKEFLVSASPSFCFILARLLARRLKNATDYLVDVKSQYKDCQDHFVMIDGVLESLIYQQDECCQPGSERYPDTTI